MNHNCLRGTLCRALFRVKSSSISCLADFSKGVRIAWIEYFRGFVSASCEKANGMKTYSKSLGRMTGAAPSLAVEVYEWAEAFRASRLWFDSAPEALGALANLFQYCFKTSQFFGARIGKDFPNFGSMFAKNRRDQFFAS